MPKVILIGSPQTQWNIGDRFVNGGTTVELTDVEIKKHKDVIKEQIGKAAKQTEETIEPKLTEKDYLAWNKAKQVEELTKLGIKPASLEADRVKQLMEAQK